MMLKTYCKILILPALLFVVACSTNQDLKIKYSNSEITYSGRIDTSRIDAAELYWSGTSIQLNFEGESISGLFKDEKGDNYYNVIIDNDSPFLFRPDTTKNLHLLAKNLEKGKHSIKIFKRTEWNRGKSTFYGFQITGNPKVLPKSAPKKRKIEFYGNSITAGYAVEDFSGKDSPDSTFTNNFLSYSAITARHFDAKYHCICKSGIGITISWFPLIMPEMYNRLIPEDANSKWDFSLYTPDVVVINLFQNDSWLVNRPNHKEFKNRFGTKAPNDDFIIDSYRKFVQSIRKEYPEAKIICMLGNMDATQKESKWPKLVETAVKELNDAHIYTHFVPYKNTSGHPNIAEQEAIANSLIQFIDKNIEW